MTVEDIRSHFVKMPALQETNISSLQAFTDFIEHEVANAPSQLWFRGCGDTAYKLIPTIYRHPDPHAQPLDLERNLLARFRQRSIPYQKQPFTDDWDQLFFMQHFRIPTRLLDWTENPYIAMYFALAFSKDAAVDAAVWVLNPSDWNQHVLSHIGFPGRILGPAEHPMKAYAPTSEPQFLATKPVAMYGNHNSPRIVAQRGAFCIFGKGPEPMEDIYALDFPINCLIKLVFKANAKPDHLRSLHAIGFSESVVYPDLEGLAMELRRVFGFQ